ncbi:hypothetical protein LEP1GSC072_0858 [Leptospira noguchii str. Bonito]|nr:hypothetical protein LEP1GSC072_0858 [Leptospira noguchii str. Bonito]
MEIGIQIKLGIFPKFEKLQFLDLEFLLENLLHLTKGPSFTEVLMLRKIKSFHKPQKVSAQIGKISSKTEKM